MTCNLCPKGCNISEGKTGYCTARANTDGKIICQNYGKLTAISLDPIEKKPLNKFYPNTQVLSVGSYGCNFDCYFCQNYGISKEYHHTKTKDVSPKDLVMQAKSLIPKGNIGIAFTYNEPLISYEYVLDTSALAKKEGLKTVVVTNGYINKQPLERLLPYIDALNIDLKCYTPGGYAKLGGDIATVKQTVEVALNYSHVEITTLVVPGFNDSTEEISALAEYLSSLSSKIPLHLSRFFPYYKATSSAPTSVDALRKLAEVAREHLEFVFLGNCFF